MNCEGSCKHHDGAIERIHVIDEDAGHDWGWFWYCQTAIAEDIDRGLVVERATSTKVVRCNCAGTPPTMPTFRTEHLPTCPCSGLGEEVR